MVDTPKIVFSKTLRSIKGQQVRLEHGDLKDAVNRLKGLPGKDIVVYGGASFVSALIGNDLIDELHLFVNPIALVRGKTIFQAKRPLKLLSSTAYTSGIVVNSYQPVR